MDITFVGTGGGIGIPNPFCRCENCETARQAGGKSLRNSPMVLVNDDLLIDCGPSAYEGLRQLGLRLDGARTLVITHLHSDHLDPLFFWGRGVQARDTDLALLTVYAPQDALDKLLGFYAMNFGWDQATFERTTRTICHPVRAGMVKFAGRYRLHFFPAMHGISLGIEALLVGVTVAQTGYLHCYDTGPLADDVWAMLSKHRFDAVALDACIGKQVGYENPEHMTFQQTVDHAGRMRESGILKPGGVALATHFVHQSAGTHEALVADYGPRDIVVAYDGLKLSLGGP